MQIIVVKIISIDVHNPILIYPSFSVVFSMKIIIKTDGKIIPISEKTDFAAWIEVESYLSFVISYPSAEYGVAKNVSAVS